MRFVEFKQLSMPLKARLICGQGVFLSERTDGDYVIALYALADFYVEVHHRSYDSEVLMIGSFFGTGLLAPYLQQMDVNGLMQAVFRSAESRAGKSTQ